MTLAFDGPARVDGKISRALEARVRTWVRR